LVFFGFLCLVFRYGSELKINSGLGVAFALDSFSVYWVRIRKSVCVITWLFASK